MVTNILVTLYFIIGIVVFLQTMQFLAAKNQDGDPEGLDSIFSVYIGFFWPISVSIYFLYKLFRS